MENLFITEFFSSEEIELVDKVKQRDRPHPINQIRCVRDCIPYDIGRIVAANTDMAYRSIAFSNDDVIKKWLFRKKGDFLNVDDFSTSSSALGELRCFGGLLDAGFQVAPIDEGDQATPDFVVVNDCECIHIEVNSKQMTEEEAIELSTFYNTPPNFVNSGDVNVSVRIIEVTPFGKPSKGENVTENAISKLCGIKSDEKQFSDSVPSILWLDFQDELWHMDIKQSHTIPLHSLNGELTVGVLWYAFYGYKGAPIIELHSTERRHSSEIVKMQHEGRFRQKTKVDAIIISLPDSTFALENPYSAKPIPEWFWKRAIFVPRFKLEYSRLNWPCKNLSSIVENEWNIIEAWVKLPLYKQ